MQLVSTREENEKHKKDTQKYENIVWSIVAIYYLTQHHFINYN